MHNKHAKMKMEVKKASDKLRYFWLKYVSEILQMVKFENDDVMKKIEKNENQYKIYLNENCRQIYNPLKKKGGENVTFLDNKDEEFETPTNWNFDKVVNVGQIVNRNYSKLRVGQPVLTNLNCYKNIYRTLKEQRLLHHTSGARFLVFLGCDGPP